MKRRKFVTDKERSTIRDAFRKGSSISQLVKQTGRTWKTVKGIVEPVETRTVQATIPFPATERKPTAPLIDLVRYEVLAVKLGKKNKTEAFDEIATYLDE